MSYLLGVRIDDINRTAARERVKSFFDSVGQHTIFTPNSEMLVDAWSNKKFSDILNSGSLNICDGRGIQLLSRQRIERVAGVDFMLDICALAEKGWKTIFLLGSGSGEVAEKTAHELQKKFSKLKVVGWSKGPLIKIRNFQLEIRDNEEVIDKINNSKPDILFVAFGHMKQEMWIHENLFKMPSVKVAMGVGGAFDYISGKVTRAPCWMRKIGLEWMYRLVRQPSRIGRILKAILLFPILLLYQNAKIKM